MKRIPLEITLKDYPEQYHELLFGADVYDSSCSPEARVIFIDKDCGYYLKSSKKNTLSTEASLAEYFCKKGLTEPVLSYLSLDRDWMLTKRVKGEDCTYARYLDDPKRLCDTTATLLRELHGKDCSDCPVKDRMLGYKATVAENHASGRADLSLFCGEWGFSSIENAWQVYCDGRGALKSDTLLHGDYCLPNIMLDDWRFSGFIDLGNGGVGDRHVDIFWGVWTLFYNLKTHKYADRFLDAYGREAVDRDALMAIAAAEVFS